MNLNDYLNSESPIQKELNFLFHESDPLIILDIGACEGEDSIRYKRIFRNAKIYCFEPLPLNLLRIKENLTLHKFENEIEIVPVALSDCNGVAKFYVSSGTPMPKEEESSWDYGNKSSSLLSPTEELKINYPWLKFNNQIDVQTLRLDSFCDGKQISGIDLVHIDVQGAELKVLLGAGKLLNNIKAIWLEVESIELYESQPLKSEIETFMKTHGFLKLKDTVDQISGDQLFYNERNISIFKLFGFRLLELKTGLQRRAARVLKKLL